MKMKTLICLSTVMLLMNVASARQPATAQTSSGGTAATGKIVGPSNNPEPGAPVQIIGLPGQTTAITDNKGSWSLYNLPPGSYKVKVIGED